ncbi:MAG TPA: alanine racemase [Flavobacteriaceae bacterium]|nr:alanine racemase [Flavobacteriaceae bacterium]
MSKIRQTTLEINLQSLSHNFQYLSSHLSKNTKLMAVVKAFSYGNNPVVIGKKLIELGADYLAVAYDTEAIDLRLAGIKKPILIFHPYAVNFEKIIEHQLTPSIFSKKKLERFIDVAEKQQQKAYPIHLKLNTGFNRLGFEPENLDFISEKLAQTEAVKVEGIFSHLAASQDPQERDFTLLQLKNFKVLSENIINKLNHNPLRHLCNTSGILNYPEAHFDMVRTGIGLYGYGNAAEIDAQLKPVGSLKTVISQIHHLEEGDSVGYNRRFIASKKMQTATLSLGYADGIHRHYSNGKTAVFVNGKPAPIIGDICMDMFMIDVTNINCEEGTEVTIFGAEQSAEDFAKAAGTISYEVITTIAHRVKRVIIE